MGIDARALFSALLGLALLGLSAATQVAVAVELVMFDASWCGYCRRFKAEVLPTYAYSDLGAKLPIEIVDLSDQHNLGFDLDDRIDGVPTFVLVKNGVEVARFSGYSGPHRFYAELEENARDHLED